MAAKIDVSTVIQVTLEVSTWEVEIRRPPIGVYQLVAESLRQLTRPGSVTAHNSAEEFARHVLETLRKVNLDCVSVVYHYAANATAIATFTETETT